MKLREYFLLNESLDKLPKDYESKIIDNLSDYYETEFIALDRTYLFKALLSEHGWELIIEDKETGKTTLFRERKFTNPVWVTWIEEVNNFAKIKRSPPIYFSGGDVTLESLYASRQFQAILSAKTKYKLKDSFENYDKKICFRFIR